MSKEMVNHPQHYCREGRKECIEEMKDIFGESNVRIFCLLNAYKYKYRAGAKEGNSAEQDLKKAEWYEEYASYLDVDQKFIADYYGIENQSDQLIEEMAELIQSLCKMKRFAEYEENLYEEIADVQNMLEQIIYLLKCEDEVIKIRKQKIERQLERIEKIEGNN